MPATNANTSKYPHSHQLIRPTLFLTPIELAARWRVTVDHLYRQVLARDLPAIRVGNGRRSRWRIALGDIEHYESTHRVMYSPLTASHDTPEGNAP